ncbi:hypothetical protein [Sphingobium jiangsuense]|nr:hypothetical protein [Sphingobium jiangsuense]
MSSLKIVPLRDICAKDIAAQFRRMADEIDAGEIGHIESMVACAEIDGAIEIFGWGNIDGLRAIAMFNLGHAKLVAGTLEAM